MGKKKKLFSTDDINKNRREFIRSAEQDFKSKNPDWPTQLPFQSGLYHSDAPEPALEFKMAEGAALINTQGLRNAKHNAWIILGMDRPDSIRSGYGRTGSRSNAIDLVVGRMSAARGGKGPEDGTHVDNMFGADAARVYISQLTDIDANFGLAAGKIGSAKARSGIGIKADGVRIIGREGVKIVTGKCDGCKYGGIDKGEPNSLGGKIVRPAPGIELIAGNNTGTRKVWGGFRKPGFEHIPYLQPVLLGFQTRDSLRELSFLIDKLWAAVFNFMWIQGWYNSAIAVNLFPLNALQHGIMGIWTGAMMTPWVGEMLYSMRNQKLEWEVNYLQPFGYKYICSRNVRAT